MEQTAENKDKTKKNNYRRKDYIKHLLKVEDDNQRKMHEIVVKSVEERQSLVESLYQIVDDREHESLADKISDATSGFIGTWRFIVAFITFLLVWMWYNFDATRSFDPYPFILLNLALSCLAAFQAPIILMSQNRQAQKDRKRSENDYLVNLKSELEIRELNQKIELLMVDQMKVLLDSQKEQFKRLNRLEYRLFSYLNSSSNKRASHDIAE
jgi:uncharacterized membrane protein